MHLLHNVMEVEEHVGVKRRPEQALVETRPLKRLHRIVMSLEDWQAPVYSEALFDALFTMPLVQLQQQFGWHDAHFAEKSLDYHYPIQQLDSLTHKSLFTLNQCCVKLSHLRHSQVRITDVVEEWHAIVSNCTLTFIGPIEEFAGCSISMIDNTTPLHLDPLVFYEGKRRLDVAQLSQPDQWCYVRSKSPMLINFREPDGVFILCNTNAQCQFSLAECHLEFWTSQADVEQPLRYSVDNAQILYAIQAMARNPPPPHNPLYDSLPSTQLSVRYGGERGSFCGDMDRFVLLTVLQAHFIPGESVPLFYLNNQQLPVQLGQGGSTGSTLTVFYQDFALSDVFFSRKECTLRMRLIYNEEKRRANCYYSYGTDVV